MSTDNLKIVQALVPDDIITAHLVRFAGLDKHKARECEAIVRQVLIAQMQREAVQPSEFEQWLNAQRDQRVAEVFHEIVSRAQALDSQLQQPDDVGSLEYRGNSVSFIHSKMTAYRTAIDEAWAALRECGQPPDGKTRLPDAIRALAALQQSDGHSTPSASEASTVPLPLFAVGVAKRKWESLQADGYRMQRIEFARSINGQETRGSIDPWGKVLWSRRSEAGAQQQDDHAGSPAPSESRKAVLSDEEIDIVQEECDAFVCDCCDIRIHEFARAILARAGIGGSRHE